MAPSKIDETGLTNGQRRKLNALRKSVGNEIGDRAFRDWLASQKDANKPDENAEMIANALWPMVSGGKLSIARSGYVIKRGRGRLVVEAISK